MSDRGVVLDIDGTLIDSNDAHARAWVDVGEDLGYPIAYDDARRMIGMGGDKVLPELTGLENGSPEADRVKERRGEIFRERYSGSLRAFPDARALLERMKRSGAKLVVATSANREDMEVLLDQAGLSDLIDHAVTASDAEHSKPDPDIIQAALEECPGGRGIMLGDTPYDVEAANRAGIQAVALRCGGWDDGALGDAIAIYDDPAELLARFDDSPFARG